MLANGSLADVVLFGSFLAWAVADRISLKRRTPRPVPGAPPGKANDLIAVVGGLGLYVASSSGCTRFCSGSPRWVSSRYPLDADHASRAVTDLCALAVRDAVVAQVLERRWQQRQQLLDVPKGVGAISCHSRKPDLHRAVPRNATAIVAIPKDEDHGYTMRC